MIQKKICMLGAFAVGKTCLVRRYVKSMFDEKYITTVGVKIDKKIVELDGEQYMLMLWDMEGEDDFHTIKMSYLRGASGYLVVADGTREETLDTALDIHFRAKEAVGDVPFILLINKSDLHTLWEISDSTLKKIAGTGVDLRITSAKTGSGVEKTFVDLTRAMAGKL